MVRFEGEVVPRVLLDLCEADAVLGAHDKDLVQEVNGLLGELLDALWVLGVGSPVLAVLKLVDLLLCPGRVWVGVVVVVKRETAQEHDVEEHPRTPYVGGLGVIPGLVLAGTDDLGGHVDRGPDLREEVCALRVLPPALGKSKVADLDVRRVAPIEEGVVELEVPVSHVVVVAELDGVDDLLEKIPSLFLRQKETLSRFWEPICHILSQRATACILHRYSEVRVCQQSACALNDVEMPFTKLTLNLDFSQHHRLQDLWYRTLDKLDCQAFPCLLLTNEPALACASST
mmetsp:Transcript_6361/g.15284  ORF Transcript_6361/g.15284 Transcript_6361/m.15284 type:complete len:287 (-) Transcript_6361:310-1170(-)